MHNNLYMPYSQQNSIDRINEQINQLEKMKTQLQQPIQQPSINQTFQLAPTRDVIRYANNMEEVQRDMVIGETPYFSKDLSIVWIKDTKGNIRTFELNEIIAKDDKDIKIEYLQAQIDELMKGMKKNECNANVNEPITNAVKEQKSTDVSTISKYDKKSKQSSRDVNADDE